MNPRRADQRRDVFSGTGCRQESQQNGQKERFDGKEGSHAIDQVVAGDGLTIQVHEYAGVMSQNGHRFLGTCVF
jgi:hypothetical protein